MILTVGLTGGIASGKSTVAKRLEALGAHVVDADRVVHELYAPGRAGHRALVSRYGDSILTSEGLIDRRALSRTALSTPAGARELNELIHPLVIAEEGARIAAIRGEGIDTIVVVEATLLIESGGVERYDRIVVVDTTPEIQLERAVARGLTEDEARIRIARQLDRDSRLKHADFVIDTGGTVSSTLEQTDTVWAALQNELEARTK